MDMGTVTLTLEDKQPSSDPNAMPEAAPQDPNPKDPNQGPPDASKPEASKAKDAKPAPERKRPRNLTEDKRFKLFSGTANRPLAEEIARHIGVTVGEAKIQRFADGEIYFQSLENVRGSSAPRRGTCPSNKSSICSRRSGLKVRRSSWPTPAPAGPTPSAMPPRWSPAAWWIAF